LLIDNLLSRAYIQFRPRAENKIQKQTKVGLNQMANVNTTKGNTSGNKSPQQKPSTGTVSGLKKAEFTKPYQTVTAISEWRTEIRVACNLSIPAERRLQFQSWIKEGVSLAFQMNGSETPNVFSASLIATRPTGEGVTSEREEIRLNTAQVSELGILQGYAQEYAVMKAGGLQTASTSTGNTSSGAGRGRMAQAEHDTIARLYTDEKLSMAQIAAKQNRSVDSIEKSLKQSNVPLRTEAMR
jgi:hypothetical protein